MNKKILNRILTFAGIILLFLVISYTFVPEVLGGKIVNQSDIAGWQGMSNESVKYNESHPDDTALWTNSMFGGMPTVSISAQFKGDWTEWIYNLLLTGARPATYLFISLIGGFLLLLSFGTSTVAAIGGAIAITFCSYNMQIIQVGHNTKMQAIAYMPWVLAALVYTYRSALEKKNRKWLFPTVTGAVLFAFALSFQIKANHPQISYYLAIIILVFVIALFIKLLTIKEKKPLIIRFFTASALLLVIGCIGIATNLNKLLPTYEYAEYSMRGGSELKPQTENHNAEGLALDYATAWSYGIEETPNLMIPNFNGGSSSGDPRLKNSATEELFRQARQPHVDEIMKSLPLYWGPQPFTAGPMYMGAISVFLFILGLILLKGKDKWWIAVATVIAVFLAWGSHFMWFTKLWFDFVPLYDKFRTVSMALVILQITIPLLAFIALDRIIKKEFDGKKMTRAVLTAFGISGGFCLLFAAFPSLAGTFSGEVDKNIQDVIASALVEDRRAMLVKDALRSFFFIAAAALVILWGIKSEKSAVGKAGQRKAAIIGAAVGLLVLADLFSVDKRYLNGDHFIEPADFSSQFAQRPVDKMILDDPDIDYRVVDLSVNVFNDAHPSYWHKNIGGYSPAKMQRYQDLIEHYLAQEIYTAGGLQNSVKTVSEFEEKLPYLPVMSMLNTKYIILGGEYAPVVNKYAFGNCRFVDSFVPAASPDEEIGLLGNTDISHTAVIGNDFSWAADKIASLETSGSGDNTPRLDGQTSAESEGSAEVSEDRITMTEYAPHRLKYSCRLSSERAVVFSEIFYPKGWKAVADGKEIELFRADWILRGAILPAGEYEFTMTFEPEVFKTGEALSRASSIALFILLLLSAGGSIAANLKRREE